MSYDVRNYTLPPGQTFSVQYVGRVCAVYSASNDFLLSHDDREPQFIEAGLKLAPSGGFKKITLLNPHVEPVTVQIGLSDGDIIDSRLTASGILETRDPSDGSSFSDVISSQAGILAMMQNANDQRAALHKVGESFSFGFNSTTPIKLIDPAVNTAGAVVRTLSCYSNSNGTSIHVGPSAPSGYQDFSKKAIYYGIAEGANTGLVELPFEVPAGEGLWLSVGVSVGHYSATWDYKS